MSKTLAVLATIPGRQRTLRRCLESLRPQVDTLRVVLNGFRMVPHEVRGLVDEWCIEEEDTRGSAAKLHWARRWDGIYFGCDDDWEYPPDYVERMTRWLSLIEEPAIVCCHGRVLKPRARTFTDVVFAAAPQQENDGRWLNYPGAAGIAWDAGRMNVPEFVPGKNLEEVHLAVWAQRNRVPIWLVPHEARWLKWLLEGSGLPTIWEEEKRAGFANRNAVIEPHSRQGNGWMLYSGTTR